MLKPWSSFFPDLLPFVPGCPEPAVEFALRRAAQTFFEQTRAWKVLIDYSAVVAAEEEIELLPDDSGQAIVRIESAWYDELPMAITSVNELDDSLTSDWYASTAEIPSALVMLSPNTARLYPIPSVAATTGLRISVSVCPSEVSTGIPSALFAKYRDAISYGAKARLMLYPSSTWANPELAVVMNSEFVKAIASANLDAARAFGRTRIASKQKWC